MAAAVRDDAANRLMRWLPQAPEHDALLARYGEAYKWLALAVVGTGIIASVLATTSFNVAVPALGLHFGLGQHQVQWAITGFLAALTLAMLPTPWLLERVGFRRLFLGANLMLALTSVAGALGSDFGFVVAMRVLQGIAAGLLQPLTIMVVMRHFPAASQGRAHGLLGFGIVLAPAAAPSLAGVLLERFGWQAIFLMTVPFCIVAGVCGLYLLARSETNQRHPFDWLGVGILCAASLAAIDFITSLRQAGLMAPRTLAMLMLVALCVFAFVRHARRAPAPIVSLSLFAERSFAMGAVVGLIYGCGLYASTYLIPVFLQQALGYDAALSGLALLPGGLLLAVVIPIAGWLTDRYSPRPVMVWGLAVFGVSFLPFAVLGASISYTGVVAVCMVGRLGLGLTIPALTVASLKGVPAHQIGQASMVSNYTRQFGGVLGVAIAAVFVEWRIAIYGAQPPGIHWAYSQAFVLLTLVFGLALVAALRMKRRP